MKSILPLMSLAAIAAWIVPAAARADQVDNPQFVAWSKCAVGSSVTYERTTEGEQVVLEIKKTLKEKTDDHVTLDVSRAVPNGYTMPQQTETVPAKMDKSPDEKSMPNETIQIGGKKIDCKVAEWDEKTAAGADVKTKRWTSDEIPGGVVKLEETTSIQGKQKVMTLHLKEFDTK